MSTITRAQYMAILVPLVERFVAVVHDECWTAGSEILDTIRAVPRPAGVVPSRAVMTILAAMVDPTASQSTRLDWVRDLDPDVVTRIPLRRPA